MDRCQGALLSLQGSDDRAVPPQQRRAIVAAARLARQAGRPVACVEFEGEDHGFCQGANIVRAMELERAFLGRVFHFSPPGRPIALNIDHESALPSA